MNAPAELVLGQKISRREAGLWTFAAVSVVLAHAAASFAFQALQPPPEEVSVEETMLVELEPVAFAMAASVSPSEVISEEDVEETSPEKVHEIMEEEPPQIVDEETPKPVETEETPVEQAEAEKTPLEQAEPEETPVTQETEIARQETAEPVEQKTAEPLEEEAIEQEIAEAVEPEVVIPLPRPEHVVEETPPEEPVKTAEAKPEPKVVKKAERKKTETPKPKKRAEMPKPAKKADVRKEAKSRSESSVQQQAASTPTVNPNKWNSAVQRAIARAARRARGTRGSVSIAFVVNASGSIVSARVARSSGNSKLDGTALGIVRAARIPPPPAGLTGSHSFMLPMTFQ
ncbi:energy transducer TonB family protein [Mesorhizobium australicum]|uniref:Protein TonB n=1 Tax=Mesorhizobium australicum TaxID=536018 RepID=A0A1X7NFM4_9HYPH|nr:energy transducer TonB [Mesorhizobium australicum]SMH36568.1 protein TonB [Mesorhizobium australicum]